MLFPAIKLLYLLVAYTTMATGGGARQRMLNRMSWLGKWSMLDVLVLALVIFYVKASALTEAAALPGIYFFSAAVLMTMIAYALVEHSPGARDA
jgi:paraquat-inducible protein A